MHSITKLNQTAWTKQSIKRVSSIARSTQKDSKESFYRRRRKANNR